MALHNTLGAAGEQYAYEFLIKEGFIVRERNWTINHLEIDIIAERKGTFHFIEVKTRSQKNGYDPRKSINRQKQQNLINASRVYCKMHQSMHFGVQYDVILVYGTPGNFQMEYMPGYFRMPTRTYR
ncbi:MAG: YraN family protein [Bacteroidales bacterium]|nr:YraN family protein [Bacteroidales bacterium]